jgi:hypothetical protein
MRALNFDPDGRTRPAKTAFRTAVPCTLLIRMRSQVQVLAGPPPIPAGHSAAGSEPGAPAAGLGRVGAARLSAGTPIGPFPGPIHPGGRLHDDHAPWSPTQPKSGSHPAGAATPRRQPAALRTPAWPAWSLSGYARPPHPTRPGRQRLPTDQRATPAASPAPQACSAVDRAARRRGSPPGPRPVPVVTGAPPHRPGLQRHRPMWEETDASGPTGRTPDRLDTGGVDTGGVDTGRAGRWTGGHQPSGPPDPGRRPQVTGHRTGWTPDGLHCRIPDDDTGWVDSAWWTPTGDRRRGWRPGLAGRGDDGRPLDAGRTLRRAGAVWASNNQDRSAARTPRAPTLLRTGLATAATVSCRWYAAVQLAPRRTAVLGWIRVEGRAGGRASSVMASAEAAADCCCSVLRC